MSTVDPAKSDIISKVKAAQVFHSIYEIKNILGRGASSQVIRVVHRQNLQQFAAKIVDLSLESQDQEDADFYKRAVFAEIAVLRQCQGSPHIIKLFDFFESETYAYLILQLCPNGELFDLHTKEVTFSEKKTRNFMEQILEAVEFLHSRHIIHRDLKLENILIDDQFRLVISDFGFARFLRPNEKLFDVCGTVHYMAPELVLCSMDDESPGYGMEVDLWACGIICFTLLFGQPPFAMESRARPARRYRQSTQMTLIRRIIELDYQFPPHSAISECTKDFICRLLTRDPGNRVSVTEATEHPFVRGQCIEPHKVSVFKKCAIVVWSVVRFKSMLRMGPRGSCLVENPYDVTTLQRVINNASFIVYRHWVKIGDKQSPATLFNNDQ